MYWFANKLSTSIALTNSCSVCDRKHDRDHERDHLKNFSSRSGLRSWNAPWSTIGMAISKKRDRSQPCSYMAIGLTIFHTHLGYSWSSVLSSFVILIVFAPKMFKLIESNHILLANKIYFAQLVGFGPTLPEGIWFRFRRLNHSATTAFGKWEAVSNENKSRIGWWNLYAISQILWFRPQYFAVSRKMEKKRTAPLCDNCDILL